MNIYLKDYLHLAENGNSTPAVLEALFACRGQQNATLVLGDGCYHFWPDHATVREYWPSNNDGGRKPVAFPLIGFDGLTVDGQGADLVFHGGISPFILDGCSNVTVRGVSVDYVRPFYSQGKIVRCGEDYTDLTFTEEYPFTVEDGVLIFFDPESGISSRGLEQMTLLVTEFDAEKRIPAGDPYLMRWHAPKEANFLDFMTRTVRAELLPDGAVRLHGVTGHTVGNYWVCTHSKRDYPGFFLQNSTDTLLEDITLYHSASMGVIGQLCENITLRRVKTGLCGDRLLTVNADATHFVHCSGNLLLEDCSFTHMLDDAGNIHGIYTVIKDFPAPDTMTVQLMHFQQHGVLPYRPGDEIALVERRTLTRIATATVKDAALINEQLIRIQLTQPLPSAAAIGLGVENYTCMPNVTIRGCTVGWNRPRGFLISTCKPVLIEDCSFSNMYSAIEMSGDAGSWFESGCVQNVTVRGCRFSDSAYTAGAAISFVPMLPKGENLLYHSGFTVENCLFEQDTPRIVYARNTRNLTFKNNRWHKIDSVGGAHEKLGENGFLFEECANMSVEPLTEV